MNKKKIIIPIVIVALLVGAFFGAKKIRTANTTVEVQPVSLLNWGYMENSMSIDGYVYDQDSQSIYPDATQIISEVYVKEGQQVKKGDKLMAYDMASQELTLQIRKVAVEKARNNLSRANAELNALYNTTPVPDYVVPDIPIMPDDPSNPGQPEEQEKKKPEHKKEKDAWNYLDETNIDDYYLDPILTIINNSNAENPIDANSQVTRNTVGEDDPAAEASGGTSNNPGDAATNSGETSVNPGETSVNPGESTENPAGTTDDSSESEADEGGDGAYDREDIHIEPPEDGSLNNPYRYIVTEDGVLYGSFLNELRKKENKYAMIEIRDENKKEGDLLASMILNTNKIKEQDEEAYWYVILRADGEDPFAALIEQANAVDAGESNIDDYGTDYFNTDQPIQYTASELALAIRDKRREVKALDLDLRRTELDLKMLQEQMEDGVVTAKRDGVVTLVHDIDNPPLDGSAFMKVDAGSGVVVQGNISELLLETITVGQEITATDWESGGMFTGEITSIDDYPTDQGYFYGGNPNSSYYSFLAYFDDAENLESGRWLQMSLDANANKEEGLYIPNAYIRSDSQGKYVMKDDNGVLAKQYVKCGRSYYGYVTEIQEGITQDDNIAFPYGDGAEAGAKTKMAETGEVMW